MSTIGIVLVCGCLMLSTGCLAGSDPQFMTDVFSHSYGYRQKIDLAGTWELHRDKESRGKELGWHEGKGEFTQTIRIPGCPQAQGIGEPSESMKNRLDEPFWVRRTFTMPETQRGSGVGFGNSASLSSRKTVWLRIGGVLPAAEVYINGRYIGYTQSSRTQQRVDVTDAIASGPTMGGSLIAIKVCDWPKVKLEGIWEMGELQRVWTGVYGPISLEITDPVSLMDVYASPNLATKSVHVDMRLTEAASEAVQVELVAKDGNRTMGSARVTIPAGKTEAETDVKLSEFTTWSPNHPKLYDLVVSLRTPSPGG